MGCSESKDLRPITVSDAQKKLQSSIQGLEVVRLSSSGSSSTASASSVPHTPEEQGGRKERENSDIPASLDSIPTNDLGESLDCRGGGGWLKSAAAAASAHSVDSSDSGIYELDDDYSFVITENSPAELVRRVELDFTPVENLDLTLTGKQCPRLLSGYQKARQEEAAILASLREEGFIATSKQKCSTGMAFEIVEATPATESASSSKIKPKDFLPEETKRHLERQRDKHHLRDLTQEDVRMKMHLANERRQAELETKKKTAGLFRKENTAEKKVQEMKQKVAQKKDAALEKREAHLKELRDKLQAQNQKAKQVKLKKLINGPPVPVRMGPGKQVFVGRDDGDSFFD